MSERGGARRSRPPLLVSIGAVAAVAVVVVPLIALFVEVPWTDLGGLLGDDRSTDALKLSVLTSTLATMLSLVLGLPLAWVLARSDFRGRTLVRALITLPMVLPPVVGGAALLAAFGRRGLVGEQLDRAGILLPYSTGGVVLAQVFVAMPFLVVTVEAGIRSIDARYEDVAATLGASRWRTFATVTSPLMGPSAVAGTVLCWARAMGEFGATITFAGNLQGRTQTLPLAIYLGLQGDRDAALAMSLLLVVLSLAVLVSLRDRWFRVAP